MMLRTVAHSCNHNLNRSFLLQVLLCLVAAAWAQFEAGFVKILQDKRYQEGSSFGNYRDQEDGIKYFEETDANGVRRGYWEYPSDGGQVLRTEFEGTEFYSFRTYLRSLKINVDFIFS